jgi:hypothetical protein
MGHCTVVNVFNQLQNFSRIVNLIVHRAAIAGGRVLRAMNWPVRRAGKQHDHLAGPC